MRVVPYFILSPYQHQGLKGPKVTLVKPNLLINIKAWIQLGPLVTYEGSIQVLVPPKSLLVWKP